MPTDARFICNISRRHGLSTDVHAMHRLGMENELWALGESHVLRIPLRGNPAGMVVEALTVPEAVRAGIRTPRLLAFDQSREVIDDVYTIYERAAGVTLGTLPCDLPELDQVLRDLAEDIVKLHRLPNPQEKLASYHSPDPEHDFRALVDAGRLSTADADFLQTWMSRLRPYVERQPPPVFTHSDLHPWNLMAQEGRLSAILDWSDCAWADPAFDLIGFPLPLMAELLEAYRRAGGRTDDGIEARMLWYWLDLAMWEIGELDSGNFRRCWWRWPEGGLDKTITNLKEAGVCWQELAPR